MKRKVPEWVWVILLLAIFIFADAIVEALT